MKMKNMAIAMIAGLGTLLSPFAAQAQEVPFVDQGDRIMMEIPGRPNPACVVGYVDPGKRTLTTVGHCSDGQVGNVVRTLDGTYIGRVIENPHNRRNENQDMATVRVENAHLGNNRFTGFRWASPSELRLGDQACLYSATSGEIRCGEISGKRSPRVVTVSPDMAQPGDSGGPAWVPGKGFIGLIASGVGGTTTYITYPDMNYAFGVSGMIARAQNDLNNGINQARVNFENSVNSIVQSVAPGSPRFQVPMSSF